MPPDRDRVVENAEDDDMPALDDNPNSSFTYTFFSEMTPLSFSSNSASTATQDLSPQPSTSFVSSPPPSPIIPDDASMARPSPMLPTRPHNKRRDPSYIPRPPNAFILFRSAFIRDQNVPGKVEGNHSTLSKIIGLCWRRLTPEERKKWEDAAAEAQVEHRKRYPDWRFRPSTNSLAKREVGAVAAQRRSNRTRTKDPPPQDDAQVEEPPNVEGKGKAKESGRSKSKSGRTIALEESRCATIAGLVTEGIKGEELEAAVKKWEGDHKATPKVASIKTKTKPSRSRSARGVESSGYKHAHSMSHSSSTVVHPPPQSDPQKHSLGPSAGSTSPHAQDSPQAPLDVNEPGATDTNIINSNINNPSSLPPGVPLTHMFKRSLSAPAPDSRLAYPASPSEPSDESSPGDSSPTTTWGTSPFEPRGPQQGPTRTHNHHLRRDTISFPMPSSSSSRPFDHPERNTWQEAQNRQPIDQLPQESDPWWTNPNSSMGRSNFEYVQSRESREETMDTSRMGYEGSSQFDRSYIEHYGGYEAPQPTNQNAQWTDLATGNRDRQGLVTVIEDPYKDDCDLPATGTVCAPPTLSLPPLSVSSYYYNNPASVPSTPSSTFPPSSFSTLTGWAGEYKYQTPIPRNWPQHSGSGDDSTWYQPDGSTTWGVSHPELQHHGSAMDAEDWDRLEYRAGRDMGLDVGPQRELSSFPNEIRRMHANAP